MRLSRSSSLRFAIEEKDRYHFLDCSYILVSCFVGSRGSRGFLPLCCDLYIRFCPTFGPLFLPSLVLEVLGSATWSFTLGFTNVLRCASYQVLFFLLSP